MKLAAIDIGSNAVRLQISAVLEGNTAPIFKKVEYLRFPLRLGVDVFSSGSIGHAAELKFIKLMQTFKLLLELFEVDSYYACATSALRTAANGEELVQKVLSATGISINIIDGEQEASFIDMALQNSLPSGYCLHIDVGGGSTELNLYHDLQKIATESFPLGSVRNHQGNDRPEDWKSLEKWVKKHFAELGEEAVMAVGTGGNISKLLSMSGRKPGETINLEQLQTLRNFIHNHTVEERLNKLQLNPDRADVIIPAADIYIHIMQWAGCHIIQAPNLGLKDGLIKQAYLQRK